MAEPVRSLFVPLSLAVGFAMISSYLLSSTVVPVLSVWLLKHHGTHEARSASAGAETPSGRPRFLPRLRRRRSEEHTSELQSLTLFPYTPLFRSYGRAGAVAVRAAVAGGRLRHDLVVPAVQHGRAGAVRLAAEAPRNP